MTILITLLGAFIVFATLIDIFNVLFHPLGSGRVSRILVRFTWHVFRYLGSYRHTILELAGPSAVAIVIGGWVVLLTIGWALVYWPYLSSGEFMFASGLDPATHSGFIDSLYLSMTTITTLGYGDITPSSAGFRMLAPLEAMLGFGLLTASLSWVISIYQVLRRRRTLALEINLLREEEQSAVGLALAQMDPMVAQQVLGGLDSQLRNAWNDLVQFPITYYFTSSDSQTALSMALPYLLSLIDEGTSADCPPEVRLRASILRGTLRALTSLLTRNFLNLSPTAPAKEILEAYALDHLQEPKSSVPG